MIQTLDRRDAPTRSRAGPRLTIGQRAILTHLVAQLQTVERVRAQIAADYPDFPPISDDLIRYYRRQLNTETTRAALALRTLALQTSLAQKAVRVAQLIRMAEQWRRVPLVEQRVTIDGRGMPQIGYMVRLDASRELRAILKQIAMELGQFGAAESPAEPDDDRLEDGWDETISAELDELLRRAVGGGSGALA